MDEGRDKTHGGEKSREQKCGLGHEERIMQWS
jgi:hypothetical protein